MKFFIRTVLGFISFFLVVLALSLGIPFVSFIQADAAYQEAVRQHKAAVDYESSVRKRFVSHELHPTALGGENYDELATSVKLAAENTIRWTRVVEQTRETAETARDKLNIRAKSLWTAFRPEL